MKLRCRDCKKPVHINAPRGAKAPRHWRCNWCIRERSESRRKARVEKRKLLTDRSTPYPETDWRKNRRGSLSHFCQCCGLAYIKKAFTICGILQRRRVEHIHHLICKRLAVKHGLCDAPVNLFSACNECHGRLKRLDNLILRNDWVAAVAEARAIGSIRSEHENELLPRLVAAAEHYGFNIGRLCTEKETLNGQH